MVFQNLETYIHTQPCYILRRIRRELQNILPPIPCTPLKDAEASIHFKYTGMKPEQFLGISTQLWIQKQGILALNSI